MEMKNRINKSNIAIKDDRGHQITYEELWNKAQDLYKIMSNRRVVFILCDNSLEALSFYFETMSIGNVPLLLPFSIEEERLKKLFDLYNPKFIWGKCSKEFDNFKYILEDGEYKLWETEFKDIEVNSELAQLMMTSGTSGSSKVVRISYRNLQSNTEAAVKRLLMTEKDRGITTLPMNFCYGTSFLHIHWYVGATILATDYSIFSKEFWDFFEKENVTNFAGVADTYKMLKLSGFFNNTYPSLRFVTQGGNKMPLDLIKIFLEKMPNVKLYSCYGQTEGTAFLSTLDCRENYSIIDSVGQLVDCWKIEIENINDSGVGEVVLFGDSACMGYADSSKDLVLGNINNGILHTGDLGRLDGEKNIYLVGRISRILKLMGKRISLDDIEELIRKLRPEIDCACIGNDDNLVLVHTEQSLNSKEIKRYIANSIQVNEKLISVNYLKTIPKTSSGKINYGELNGL